MLKGDVSPPHGDFGVVSQPGIGGLLRCGEPACRALCMGMLTTFLCTLRLLWGRGGDEGERED